MEATSDKRLSMPYVDRSFSTCFDRRLNRLRSCEAAKLRSFHGMRRLAAAGMQHTFPMLGGQFQIPGKMARSGLPLNTIEVRSAVQPEPCYISFSQFTLGGLAAPSRRLGVDLELHVDANSEYQLQAQIQNGTSKLIVLGLFEYESRSTRSLALLRRGHCRGAGRIFEGHAGALASPRCCATQANQQSVPGFGFWPQKVEFAGRGGQSRVELGKAEGRRAPASRMHARLAAPLQAR